MYLMIPARPWVWLLRVWCLDNLSWVVTKTANIGVDFDLWNGKLCRYCRSVIDRVNDGILAKPHHGYAPEYIRCQLPERKSLTRNRKHAVLKLNSEHSG